LHCATFAVCTVGPAVLAAALTSQGGSPSVAKVAFLLACLLLSGAALSHAIGRAQSSTYVLLLAAGFRWGAGAPIFYDHPPGTPAVDPVMQALVLTDIVIGVTVAALLLALAVQAHKAAGSLDPDDLRPMAG
jgi:multisubunit Na+/H+ antiporter MnhC subunit